MVVDLIALDHVSVIEIAGEDAHSFLQRQLTVEMNEVTPTQSLLAAYLNPKGRVIATFILMMRQEKYYLIVSNELAETLHNRLRMYVFREKIVISQRPDLIFAGSRDVLGDIDPELLQRSFQTFTADDLTVVRVPGDPPRFGVLAKPNQISHLSQDTNLIDLGSWQAQDIESGIPWINKSTTETLIAQAINLDLTGSISWKKGCFPGQEIVARMHYRGGVNRRMVQATCHPDANPNPGDLVNCPDLSGNQTGSVVNCTNDKNGSDSNLLISVPLKFVGQRNLLLSDSFPVKIRTDGLPYAIPQLDQPS